jgi:hypothetical protein
MVPARCLCRKHLLGEHVETHMFLGTLKRRKNVAGFLSRGLLEPASLYLRHAELAGEMRSRGYTHASQMKEGEVRAALKSLGGAELGARVDRERSASELSRRCEACRTSLEDSKDKSV